MACEVDRVELVSPMADYPSMELRSVLDTDQLKLYFEDAYAIELGFYGKSQGQQIDLRSELPLVIRWLVVQYDLANGTISYRTTTRVTARKPARADAARENNAELNTHQAAPAAAFRVSRTCFWVAFLMASRRLCVSF